MSDDDFYGSKRRKVDHDDDQGAENMSIEESNKLRAKLGLKPLEITTDEKADDGTIMGKDGTAFHHAPAESLTAKKKGDKIKKKIDERRKKRDIEKKLSKIKGLGESDSDDGGIKSWVQKSRKKEKERKKADRKEAAIRAREADMAEEIKVLEQEKRQKLYNRNALKGMTIEHTIHNFSEGKDVIMTLKDSNIMAEEAGTSEGDVLVNVNMVDTDKAEKYKENVKKSKNKVGYNPLEKYDEENIEAAAFGQTKLLSKYDETIEGENKKRFTIGQDGNISTVALEIQKQMREDMAKNAVNLNLTDIKIASDYYTPEEAQGFKKRKRKVKKVRKTGMQLMDDVLERRDFEANPFNDSTKGSSKKSKDHGSRNWKRGKDEEEQKKIKNQNEEITITEEELQAQLDAAARNLGEEVKVVDTVKTDVVVTSSLERTRRLLKSRAKMEMRDPAASLRERIQEISHSVKPVEKEEGAEFKTDLILNDVDEFCRAVGQANAEKIYEREKEIAKEQEAAVKHEKQIEIDVEEEFRKIRNQVKGIRKPKPEPEDGVEREPLAHIGLAGAIKVAAAKGYLEKNTTKTVNVDSKHKERISANTYSIEDKNRVDHLDKYAADKYRRDSRREKTGSLMDFPELKDYKPNIQIEYVDEIGRPKTEKEAFRDLSHRFHGKGSGKMKQEKRQKRLHEESSLQQMSSTDTPLNTVEMLRRKQKQTKSPFINLTGGAMLSAGAKISKN